MKEKLYRFLKRMEACTDKGVLAMDRSETISGIAFSMIYLGIAFVLICYLPEPYNQFAGILLPIGIFTWILSVVVVSLVESLLDIPLTTIFYQRYKQEEKSIWKMEDDFLTLAEGAIETAIPGELQEEYYLRLVGAMRYDHSQPYAELNLREFIFKPWGSRDLYEKRLLVMMGIMAVLLLAVTVTIISVFIYQA